VAHPQLFHSAHVVKQICHARLRDNRRKVVGEPDVAGIQSPPPVDSMRWVVLIGLFHRLLQVGMFGQHLLPALLQQFLARAVQLLALGVDIL